MAKKDLMTVKEIGRKEGDSLFRDWKDDTDYGVIYYEDKKSKFLMRQILPIKQDVELVKKIRKQMQREEVLVRFESDKIIYKSADEVLPPETDREILQLIENANPKNNDIGSVSVIVFNSYTKEFIAALDIAPVPGTDYQVGGITFMYPSNQLVKRRYERNLKKWVNELFIEKGLYPKGCREAVWNGKDYEFIPI